MDVEQKKYRIRRQILTAQARICVVYTHTSTIMHKHSVQPELSIPVCPLFPCNLLSCSTHIQTDGIRWKPLEKGTGWVRDLVKKPIALPMGKQIFREFFCWQLRNCRIRVSCEGEKKGLGFFCFFIALFLSKGLYKMLSYIWHEITDKCKVSL